ncbi:hypothetical protein [Fictibacillus sp. S7]|uniref:hypothetical protein n=1 Tax=Fictibacillus sp. S7 TaxID=2212476 RepID=UPI0019D702D4|nr:hypothetical protein [Fictibacillus sp. S7]
MSWCCSAQLQPFHTIESIAASCHDQYGWRNGSKKREKSGITDLKINQSPQPHSHEKYSVEVHHPNQKRRFYVSEQIQLVMNENRKKEQYSLAITKQEEQQECCRNPKGTARC